ncbi:MAG: cation:proton antiporter [Candidatus Altiarchaeota archaeon]|nr:cation:proton antiporter [Candidatus Altiarchaeota archaeon]
MTINPGVSEIYNLWGVKIAPNMITVILFDFRGYDTLGECVILVAGVLALTMLYGRGSLTETAEDHVEPSIKTTTLLAASSKLILPLVVALGVYVTLGGHITPGGGFQGGSIIAAGFFMVVVLYGVKAVGFTHENLVKMESFGILIYILLGLVGLYFSGYFLYNTGTDLHGLVAEDIELAFNYPDGLSAGIIPYLNIAVLIKVSAGLTTALLVILEGGKK